jgi:alkylation response protein AidB-like acyl-CoA dehydrogenase
VAERHVTYAPTEEQELIRSTARQFLAERFDMETVRELMMSEDGFDRGQYKEMADLGWTGLAIAEEHGGAGLGPVEMGTLLEEMGRRVTPGPFFASAVMATTFLQETGKSDDFDRFLPSLASGDSIGTVALYDSPRGWNITPSTRFSEAEDGFVLNGSKRAVLDAGIADLILVTATDGDETGLFAVDPTAVGVEVVAESVLDPTRRQFTVGLADVTVAADDRIGAGDVSKGLRRALSLATVALASEQVGGAQAAMDMAVDYAKTRYQFGRPIGSYQSIKHRCANMLMKVEHARTTALYGARVTDDPDELAIAAPLAGSTCSETYTWVAGENIQVHGGIGFTWEHDAHIYLKRAKTSSLLLGSPRHQRDLLGQALEI